jgi:hypothetical protein
MITSDDAGGKLARVLRVEFKFQDLTLSSRYESIHRPGKRSAFRIFLKVAPCYERVLQGYMLFFRGI